MWLPSHCSIRGNERADDLAKHDFDGNPQYNIKIPFPNLMRQTKERVKERNQELIIGQGTFKGHYYFENFHKKAVKPWFHQYNLERRTISVVTICRIRSNHHNLAASLARKGYITEAKCEFGEAHEDVKHVLFQCKKYDDNRKTVLEKLLKEGLRPPFYFLFTYYLTYYLTAWLHDYMTTWLHDMKIETILIIQSFMKIVVSCKSRISGSFLWERKKPCTKIG